MNEHIQATEEKIGNGLQIFNIQGVKIQSYAFC